MFITLTDDEGRLSLMYYVASGKLSWLGQGKVQCLCVYARRGGRGLSRGVGIIYIFVLNGCSCGGWTRGMELITAGEGRTSTTTTPLEMGTG